MNKSSQFLCTVKLHNVLYIIDKRRNSEFLGSMYCLLGATLLSLLSFKYTGIVLAVIGIFKFIRFSICSLKYDSLSKDIDKTIEDHLIDYEEYFDKLIETYR